jgi:polysaccharide export outer membrane protein
MRRFLISGSVTLLALAVMTAVALARAGQRQAKGESTLGTAAASQEQKALSATADSTYVIGPEDGLDINVWKEPDVSRAVPVRPDGKISLPLLNDIQAAGLTPMQLQEVITQGLKKFITGPQVTVIVTQINSRRIYVMGEIARPGAFPMLPNMTILQALSTAGGFSQYAKLGAIYLLRSEDGRQVTYPFNYKEVIRGRRPEQNIALKPGDTIVVP